MRRLAALAPYLLRRRRRLAAGIASNVASAGVGLIAPLLVGQAVDSLGEDVRLRALLGFAALLVAVALVQGVFTFLQRILLVTLSRDVEQDLRNDYFAHLERLPQSFYQRSYTGDLMARGTNDLQAVRMLCGPAIMYTSNTLFTAAGAVFFMYRIHPRLTLLPLLTLPLVALSTQVFGQRIHRFFERVQEQFAALATRVQENLAGARVVRAYGQEVAEERSFAVVNDEYVARNRALIRWSAAFHPLLQALIGLGFVAVLWYGGGLVLDGEISVGDLVAFNFFLTKLIWPMIAVGWVINLVQRGVASLGRILEVLETEPAIRDLRPGAPARPLEGAVRFTRLTFRYAADRPPVLEEIDVEVPAGRTVAVVGPTGAGKSTLLSLIPRLIDPPPGSLFLDGVDCRELPLEVLRGAVGVVPQETFLFSISVAENIAFGRAGASLEEIREAARAAGLGRDLATLPRGLETLVGERGITLSGGQKQRVALARALLRRPRILLLDDCFSAVDTETEEEILSGLGEVFSGRTVFLVSHRISTVRRADLILVLEAGRVIERGSHRELVAAGGLYAELDRRQRLEEELAAV